jgi:hypothetical protein
MHAQCLPHYSPGPIFPLQFNELTTADHPPLVVSDNALPRWRHSLSGFLEFLWLFPPWRQAPR